MTKKYFFFDIDGTLTDRETNETVPSAAEAIRRLKAAGHFVSIATGRAMYKGEKYRRTSDFDNMVCNGGHGIVIDGQPVENRPVDYEKALAIYREAQELGCGILVAHDDSDTVYAKDFRFYEQVGLRREPTRYIIDDRYDPTDFKDIFKMYIAISEEEEEKLTLRDTVGHLRFEKPYLLFQPDAKLEGILRMLELTGGDPENVVVFGDDTNDLVMFDDRFYKVAMGNACEELKARADYVAERNVDDGIFKACLAHGWFERG